MRRCPICEYKGPNFAVKYSSPLRYECPFCKSHHTDPTDGSGVKVLSFEEAIKARPEMYTEEDIIRIRKAAKGHNDFGERLSKALQGSCPSCHGDPNVDCSCQPWK